MGEHLEMDEPWPSSNNVAIKPLIDRFKTLQHRFLFDNEPRFVIVTVFALSWAFFNPLRDSVNILREVLPGCWERLQKPLIKMEQHAKLFEVKLKAEVTTEIAMATTSLTPSNWLIRDCWSRRHNVCSVFAGTPRGTHWKRPTWLDLAKFACGISDLKLKRRK